MIRKTLSSDIVKRLQLSLNRLLPSGAGAFADKIADNEKAFEYPKELKHLTKAVPRRRNEFIAGRRCARAALARIGVEPCKLTPDENRAPRWPVGVVGSISHSIGLCCAVTAHSDEIACLGVDLETTTRMSPGVVKRVTHPLEADYVGGDQVLGSLIFSAKEAFFKAQFATWKAWPNFNDLAFHVDTSTSQLKVISVADHLLPGLRSAALDMQYRYTFFDNYVLTLCWLKKCSKHG
jgi:4'-phosphopantetheinyl transferase EntD